MENTSQPNSLTMSDMAALVNIIEVACARGSFRANELSLVGQVYDRLKHFVSSSEVPTSVPPPETADIDQPSEQGESNA